jgi:hypothetical protein
MCAISGEVNNNHRNQLSHSKIGIATAIQASQTLSIGKAADSPEDLQMEDQI